MMRIVHRRHEASFRLESPADSPRGLRRQSTTATAQALPTTAALTSLRNGHIATRRPTAITVPRSRALTIRRPLARTRRRRLIPHQAATIQLRRAPIPRRAKAILLHHDPTPHRVVAIQLRRAPIPHRAKAIAVVAAATGAAEAAVAAAEVEVVVVEALVAGGGTNHFANSRARPDVPGGFFPFGRDALAFLLPLHLSL